VTRRVGKSCSLAAKTGAAGGERSGPGLRTISYVNQRWLGGNADQLATDSQKYRTLANTSRKSRNRPAFKKHGETGDPRRSIAKAPNSAETSTAFWKWRSCPMRSSWSTQPGSRTRQQARRLNIPTVAIVDTNADRKSSIIRLRANDDAIRGDSRDFAEIG